MLMSLCRMIGSPTSAQKSKMRSRAGLVRLATSPAILDDTNSLWMENSPIPEKTPGKVSRTRRMWSAAYMSAGLKPVIIGIQPRLLFLGQRPVGHGDGRIDERVVVQGGIRLQVVVGRKILRVGVGPHLLQRKAEEGRAADLGPHHLDVGAGVGRFLDVVRDVEMRVMEKRVFPLVGCCDRQKAAREYEREQAPEHQAAMDPTAAGAVGLTS